MCIPIPNTTATTNIANKSVGPVSGIPAGVWLVSAVLDEGPVAAILPDPEPALELVVEVDPEAFVLVFAPVAEDEFEGVLDPAVVEPFVELELPDDVEAPLFDVLLLFVDVPLPEPDSPLVLPAVLLDSSGVFATTSATTASSFGTLVPSRCR